MSSLLILIKMQLKEQLNFQRFDLKGTSWFKIIVSVLGAILKFALVTALCGAFLIVAKLLSLFSLTSTVPSTVISLVFTLMMLASVISCTVGLTKSLYFARDNAVLLTLPCKPIQVYLSKLIIFFIFELIRNFSFVVPLFIAYFITHGYAWYHYLWLMVCILLVSLFTVSVGTLLSIPAMWISNVFRQFKSLQATTLAGSIALVSFAVFHAISLIPENIDLIATWGTTFWEIQDFLNAYATKFSFIYDFTLMMLGETQNLVTTFPVGATALRFFKLFGATAVLYTVGLLIVQPLFYKMASKPFEHMKRAPRQIDWVKWNTKMISINKRKIGICILLSFLTFGIYSIYWMYLLVKNTKAVEEKSPSCLGEMLCLLFVPFYSLYWWFTRGKIVHDKFVEHNYTTAGSEILYLILGIFGFQIVSMAILQNDFNSLRSESTESVRRIVNRKLPRPVSVIWTEVLIAMKTPARIFFNVGVLFSIPMLVFLLNKIFLAMNTREMGDYMVLAFNVLIILLVVLNANTYAASVFSRDGRSSYLIKVQPAQYRTLLQAKLLPNTVFVLAALVAALFILLRYASFGTANTLMLMGAIAALYVAHLLFCAELDLMNPQNELYAAIGNSEKNPNETTATLTAFLISFVVAAALFFLMMEGSAVFFKFLIVSLALLFWRGWLFFSKIKVYYKEK